MTINFCDGFPNVAAGLTTFTPTIPKFYWDVDSQEQGIKQLCKTVQMLIDYLNEVAEQVNLDTTAVEELEALFKKFQESGFEDYYEKQLERWFNDNVDQIYKLLATQVYFGLTSDGHFCAYVPDSWSDIEFDTGAVYGRSDYGRLILRFEADPAAQGVIDNTYSYTLAEASNDSVKKLIADLEINANRTDSAYNALFTNLDA